MNQRPRPANNAAAPGVSRLRAAARRLLLFAATPLMLSMFGCDRPPKSADQTLHQLASVDVYTQRPPGNPVLLAQAQDRGLASSVASRDPSVVRIYALTQPANVVVAYYQRTYPRYGWHIDSYNPSPPDPGTRGTDLVGRSGWMNIDIYVGSAPHVPQYPASTPSQAPSGYPTYVTIYLSGSPAGATHTS